MCSNRTSPAWTACTGDQSVNFIQTPNGQSIQLNIPGNPIFTTIISNCVFTTCDFTTCDFTTLDNLVADYANGTSVQELVDDMKAIKTALNFVS